MLNMKRTQKHKGFMLLEALISILLFSIGILAVVGLQSAMVKQGTQSAMRAQAASLAESLTGKMWTDITNLGRFATTSCTPNSGDLTYSWQTQVQENLPGGCGTVAVTGSAVKITVVWTVAGEKQNKYVLDTTLVP